MVKNKEIYRIKIEQGLRKMKNKNKREEDLFLIYMILWKILQEKVKIKI